MSISTAFHFMAEADMDSRLHRSMRMDVILTSGNLALKTSFPYYCPVKQCSHLPLNSISATFTEGVWKREIKQCWSERVGAEKHSSILFSASPHWVPAQCEISSRNQGSNGSVRSDAPETAPPTPPNACPSSTRRPRHSLSSSTGCLCESYQIIHILEGGGGVYLACHCIHSPHSWIWMHPLWYYPRPP